MINLAPLKVRFDKPLAILGLGKSGMPVVEACRAAGIDTVLWDDNESARIAAGGNSVDLTTADFSQFSALCATPGIPLSYPAPHPAVARALAAGLEVLGDIELFHLAKPKVRTIGITGTNGKSTTTALITHILKEAGVPCAMGGNIGEPVLTMPDLPKNGIYVLELSSFQLDLCPTFAPDIAVLVNIDNDHLDRHGTMGEYVAAKTRIFRGKGEAVISLDDAWSVKIEEALRRQGDRHVNAASFKKPLPHGIFVSFDGILFDGNHKLLDLGTCRTLQGQHNWQNAALAAKACALAGVEHATIVRALHSFPGLAHRQSIVAVHHGITYINDSKATNDQAASMALKTYAPIYWIAGGKSKGSGYALCEKHLDRVRHAFLIGTAEDEMALWLESRKVPFTRCGTLEVATEKAHKLAELEKLTHAVVLLSPACASLDQFKNFEHRGDVFTAIVKHIAKPLIGAPA